MNENPYIAPNGKRRTPPTASVLRGVKVGLFLSAAANLAYAAYWIFPYWWINIPDEDVFWWSEIESLFGDCGIYIRYYWRLIAALFAVGGIVGGLGFGVIQFARAMYDRLSK